jgi:N-acetylglucosamine repressor
MQSMTENGRRRPAVRRPTRHKHLMVANLKADILLRVRARDDLSRVELASQMKLSPSTIGDYVDRLIADGFLVEWQKPERDYGRPPTLLALNPGGGYFIGVDFNAQRLQASIVDFSQKPVRRVQKDIRATDSVEEIIAKIEDAIEKLAGAEMRKVLGIGVGVPGSIDRQRQVAVRYAHIPGWKNIPLARLIQERFKVDVFLENNIRSMALAELWFGQGRGLDNFVCIGVRTGIAAGIIVRGVLLHGEQNLAGEIRSWLCPVRPEPRAVVEGDKAAAWQCTGLMALEKIASIPAILNAVSQGITAGESTILKHVENPISFDDVAYAFAKGDPYVRSVLADVARTLGWVCAQLNSLFNPAKIILAGPLVELGDEFLEPLQTAVNQFCAESDEAVPVIVDSELGSFGGALGAAALALHEWKPAS